MGNRGLIYAVMLIVSSLSQVLSRSIEQSSTVDPFMDFLNGKKSIEFDYKDGSVKFEDEDELKKLDPRIHDFFYDEPASKVPKKANERFPMKDIVTPNVDDFLKDFGIKNIEIREFPDLKTDDTDFLPKKANDERFPMKDIVTPNVDDIFKNFDIKNIEIREFPDLKIDDTDFHVTRWSSTKTSDPYTALYVILAFLGFALCTWYRYGNCSNPLSERRRLFVLIAAIRSRSASSENSDDNSKAVVPWKQPV